MPSPTLLRSIPRVAQDNALVFYTDADDGSTFDPSWIFSTGSTGCRVFNGTTDRIDWASIATLTASPITISAWVYISALPDHTSQIIQIHSGADSAMGITMYVLSDGTFSLYRQGTTALYRGSQNSIGTGAWVHLLATHNGTFNDRTTINLYKNGTLDQLNGSWQSGATETAPVGSWSIGGRKYDDARNFPGNIAQVGVWNRVLDASEIATLASGVKPDGISTNLLFYFAGDTSSLGATPGGNGTADGTTWSANGPTLASIRMSADYGDGTFDAGFANFYKTYEAGKGRHRVRLTCPDWSRVTSLNLYDDACVMGSPKLLSKMTKLTFLSLSTNDFTDLPSFYQSVGYTSINVVENPTNGMWPTLDPCTGLTQVLIHGAYVENNGGLYGTLPSHATLTGLVGFDCSNNRLSGELPSFAACTAMTLFECGINQFTGSLPSFNACTLLQTFSVGTNEFSGTIPTMAACTALTTVEINWCSFTGYTAGCFATQKNLANLEMQGNALTAAAVNAVLADLVTSLGGGRVACTVNLTGGTNAAPTGQGIVDKATLNGTSGWSVTTN